jgi:DNA-binding protein HU-beta
VRTVWDREAASSNLAAPTNRESCRLVTSPVSGAICRTNQHPEKEVFINTIRLEVTQTMARMTQSAIVSTLADKTGLKKSEIKTVFDALTELATSEVKRNGEFTIPGFGKLKKTNRKAREGRNPATGAIIKIPAKTTVKFSVGKAMKDSVL